MKTTGLAGRPPADGAPSVPLTSCTPPAYDRLVDRLRDHGSRYREGTAQTMAQCPSHEDREASLAIYRKPGRVKIRCFAGCDDVLDILPAIGLGLRDLWDELSNALDSHRPDPALRARIDARRNMTPLERAVDDLLQLPDLGQRLARCIAVQGGGDHE